MASDNKRAVTVDRGDDCWRAVFHAMASPCEVLFKSGQQDAAQTLAELVATEVWRIEDKFSRYRDGNMVAAINNAAGGATTVDTETAQLLDFSATLHELSDGKFDITSGVLRRIWKFDGGDKIPKQGAVKEILRLVGWHKVTWADQRIQLPAGMEIDFGGIGKEYAVDRAAGLLRRETEMSCLINLGGDLAVSRKTADNSPWQVGVKDSATVVQLRAGALATSGDSQRYAMQDGVRYSHILDSHSGWPVVDAPRSVTVAADTCSEAGMLSTLATLQGKGAEAFLDGQGVDYWCIR